MKLSDFQKVVKGMTELVPSELLNPCDAVSPVPSPQACSPLCTNSSFLPTETYQRLHTYSFINRKKETPKSLSVPYQGRCQRSIRANIVATGILWLELLTCD